MLRSILEGEKELNFKQQVEVMQFKHIMPGFMFGNTLHCASRRIGISTDDRHSIIANYVEASLVVVR